MYMLQTKQQVRSFAWLHTAQLRSHSRRQRDPQDQLLLLQDGKEASLYIQEARVRRQLETDGDVPL